MLKLYVVQDDTSEYLDVMIIVAETKKEAKQLAKEQGNNKPVIASEHELNKGYKTYFCE